MSSNPETIITKRIRKILDRSGAHTIKLSDSFTRGVPDMMVAFASLMVIELKIERSPIVDSEIAEYKQMGLSGAQDEHIRRINESAPNSAFVITARLTDPADENTRLWYPITGTNTYRQIARGVEDVLATLRSRR